MPEDTKRLSELERATSVAPSTLVFVSIEDSTSESGFSTRAMTIELLAEELLKRMQFGDLETVSKTIIEAINDAAESGGGGGGGSTVTIADNPAGGVDLTVDGVKKTLASESDLSTLKADLSELDSEVDTLSTTVGNKADKTVTDGLNTRVTNLENTPIPEQTVANAVNSYVDAHSGGFATEHSVIDGTIFSDYQLGNMMELAEDILHDHYYLYVVATGALYSQAQTGYNCFILPVKPNTDYICTNARFLLLMSDKTHAFERKDYATTFNSGEARYVAISYDYRSYSEMSYIVSKGSTLDNRPLKYQIPWIYEKPKTETNGTDTKHMNGMTSGNMVACKENHIKKNTQIFFYADINTFGEIDIGHGRNAYGSSYIKITDGHYSVRRYVGSESEVASGDLTFTIGTFLSVTIITYDNFRADITIGSSGGSQTIKGVVWDGSCGQPFALARGGHFVNCDLKFKANDYKHDIYAFGDSYVSLGSNERWVYYVINSGFDNWLLDGFAGRNSSQAIVSFRNIMSYAKPQTVLWLLGMNDTDSASAINSTWQTTVEEVMQYCDDNGIELVLATIPCTPTMHNEFKNAYVKASGRRYIDFAKAVGGENYGDSWYSGMLASDNVHPLQKGAEALYNRAVFDMPELLDSN